MLAILTQLLSVLKIKSAVQISVVTKVTSLDYYKMKNLYAACQKRQIKPGKLGKAVLMMRCVNSQMLFAEINQYANKGLIKLKYLIKSIKNLIITPHKFRLKPQKPTKREISSIELAGIYIALLMAKSIDPIANNALD